MPMLCKPKENKKVKRTPLLFRVLIVFIALMFLTLGGLYLTSIAISDIDGDGVEDSIDNCKRVSNPSQEDSETIQQITFEDDFEAGISPEWDPYFFFSGSGVSSTQSHTGSNSLFLMGGDALYKTFTSLKEGILSMWFYDDPANTIGIGGAYVFDPTTSSNLSVGTLELIAGPSGGFYQYFDGISYSNTTIPRTLGWHEIKIEIGSSGANGYIDNNLVLTNPIVNKISSISITGLSITGTMGYYYDDITFTEQIPSGDGIGDACDICPDDNTNTCNPDAGQDSIDSTGGAVTTVDGEGSVDIPLGALSENELITIEEEPGNFEITGPFGIMQIIKSYKTSPSSINFNNDIELTIYFDPAVLDPQKARVFYSSDGINWTEHNRIIERGYNYIKFLTNHFSYYTLGMLSLPGSAYTIPEEGEEVGEKVGEKIYNTHTITPYQLLEKLAEKLGTTPEKLIELNKEDYPCLGEDQWILRYIMSEIEEVEEEITPPTPPSEPSYSVYVVQPGDYLIKIANQVYGNPYRWGELVGLNKNNYPTLVTYPGSIEIGWRLRY